MIRIGSPWNRPLSRPIRTRLNDGNGGPGFDRTGICRLYSARFDGGASDARQVLPADPHGDRPPRRQGDRDADRPREDEGAILLYIGGHRIFAFAPGGELYRRIGIPNRQRSEEHTSELQSLMRTSY